MDHAAHKDKFAAPTRTENRYVNCRKIAVVVWFAMVIGFAATELAVRKENAAVVDLAGQQVCVAETNDAQRVQPGVV